MSRVRIADSSSDGTRYGHLLPVLEAELRWGNETRHGFEMAPSDQVWSARLRHPLHLDRLRAEFDFPEHIEVGRRDNGDTYVFDSKAFVSIGASDPGRRLGPPRRRTGLLGKVLGP